MIKSDTVFEWMYSFAMVLFLMFIFGQFFKACKEGIIDRAEIKACEDRCYPYNSKFDDECFCNVLEVRPDK